MKYFQLVKKRMGWLSISLLSCSLLAVSLETTTLNAHNTMEHRVMSAAYRRFCERVLLFLNKQYTKGWQQFCTENIHDLIEDDATLNAPMINCLRCIMLKDHKSIIGAKEIGNCLEKHGFYSRIPEEYKKRMPNLSTPQAIALLRALPK